MLTFGPRSQSPALRLAALEAGLIADRRQHQAEGQQHNLPSDSQLLERHRPLAEHCANRFAASGDLFTSGWNSFASFVYAFVISALVAFFATLVSGRTNLLPTVRSAESHRELSRRYAGAAVLSVSLRRRCDPLVGSC